MCNEVLNALINADSDCFKRTDKSDISILSKYSSMLKCILNWYYF